MMNNAFRNAARSTLSRARFMSTKQDPGTSLTFITMPQGKRMSRRANWFSDPACYPLIAILGGAVVFCTGVGISCLTFNPDVQIDPKHRNMKLRSWEKY
mmetsp:Transcript_18373/g.27186  ORF Transcript_18373/g.27186 Transcript_18373/m.27186 type:complete len:99 (-) Transcript_18373:140-436(-)